MNEEEEIISLSRLLIAFLVALSAFSFPFISQCPGVHLNLITLFDLKKRLLINRANGSAGILDCRLGKALSEPEHISIFISLNSRANWASLNSARYLAI